jgi:hypothetical protein
MFYFGEQNRKIFSFNHVSSKIFLIKEKKIFCFSVLPEAKLQKRSNPSSVFGADNANWQKFLLPDPPSFLLTCLGFTLFFLLGYHF